MTLNGVVASSSATVVTFTEANGTYPFRIGAVPGYTGAPTSGTVTVSGDPVSEGITFSAVTYAVTLAESGLAPGTNWSVSLGGATVTSSTSTIQFRQPNGTYTFTVGAISGYAASPSSGSLQVDGTSASQSIAFASTSSATYSVAFAESGLLSGTTWSVTLNDVAESSATPSVAFSEANGTYSFTIGSISGYTISPEGGHVTVAGQAVNVAETFTSTNGSSPPPLKTPVGSGYPLLDYEIVVGAAVGVAAIAVALAVAGYRGKTGPSRAGVPPASSGNGLPPRSP